MRGNMRYFLSECKCGRNQITHIRPTVIFCTCGRRMKAAIEVDKKLRPIGSEQPETDRKSLSASPKTIQGELNLIYND